VRGRPTAPKIIPRLLSGRKCGGVVESCLLCWFRILAKLWASTITHPCVCGRWGRRVLAPTLCDRHRASLHVYERSVGFASLRNFGRSFYKASVPYPHSASSPPSTKKSRAMPVCGSGNGAGFVKMRSLGSLHLCIDSHLCRCICAMTAICAVASCNGSVWLSLCILA